MKSKLTNQKNNIDAIMQSYAQLGGINHLEGENLPSRNQIIKTLNLLKEILFPGFFNPLSIDQNNLHYVIGQKVNELGQDLFIELLKSICLGCDIPKKCSKAQHAVCEKRAANATNQLIASIPNLRKQLKTDANAIFQGDPAAKSESMVILAYPGFQAIAIYRIAHLLYKLDVPLIPRIMTEIAHSETGIDIHPGAQIEIGFCIDHGTGVVIGETAIIGRNVKIYQGVTIGALSVKKSIKGKRHPTIEDNVTIYAHATILGGETTIGANSIIGGNVWLTESVKPNSKIYLSTKDRLIIKPNT